MDLDHPCPPLLRGPECPPQPALASVRAPAGSPGPSDAELLARIAAGDLEGLGELYLRHGGVVSAVLLRMLPPGLRSEVDDLVQDAFLEVRDLARRYEERGSARAWLIGVAVRKARNLRRKHWIRTRLLRQEPARSAWGLSGLGQVASPVEGRLDLERALERLPAGLREVLVLHTVVGCTADDIGLALGLRPGSVWARLHRARRRLLLEIERLEGRGRAEEVP